MLGLGRPVHLVVPLVLGYAAINKHRHFEATKQSVAEFGVPQRSASLAGRLIIGLELVPALLLVAHRTRGLASIIAALNLLVYTAAITVNLVTGRRPTCNCFGGLTGQPISSKTIGRNLALISLALSGSLRKRGWLPRTSATGWFAAATGLLVALVLVLVGMVVHLLDRLGAAESPFDAPARPKGDRLAIGATVPPLTGSFGDADVTTLFSGGRREPSAETSYLFVSDTCTGCLDVETWLARHVDDVARASRRVVLVTLRGTTMSERPARRLFPTFLIDGTGLRAWKIRSVPSLVTVTPDGIVIEPIASGAPSIIAALSSPAA